MKSNLRERTHEAMRSEIANAAFDLMTSNGYEALTADDLAKGVGISRATFFRYFGSKDEVVVAAMLEPDDLFADALPDAEGTTLSQWARLRSALQPAVSAAEAAPDRFRSRIRLIQSQPILGARLRRARVPQIERLAGALEGQGATSTASQVLATAAIAVLDHCWSVWAKDTSASLQGILDSAFEELEKASGKGAPA